MLIRKIECVNFRAIKNESFELPTGGFVVTGKNGSGKSSWIYALNFAFYGTVPGLTISDLLSWGEKSGRVSVWFEIRGERYKITREFNSSSTKLSLTWYPKDDDPQVYSAVGASDLLKSIFPITPDVFNEIVVKPQGEFGSLTETTPTGRYHLFRQLADIEIWEKYGKINDMVLYELRSKLSGAMGDFENANAAIKNLDLRPIDQDEFNQAEKEYQKLRKELPLINEQWIAIRSHNERVQGYLEAQETLRQYKDIPALFEEYQKVKDFKKPTEPYNEEALQKLEIFIKETPGEIEKFHKQAEELEAAVVEIEKEIQSAQDEYRLKDKANAVLGQEISTLIHQKELVEQGNCPTCGRPFEDVEGQLKAIQEQIQEIESKMYKCTDLLIKIETLNNQRNDLRAKIAYANGQVKILQRDLDRAKERAALILAAAEDTKNYQLKQEFLNKYPYDKPPSEVFALYAAASSVEKPEPAALIDEKEIREKLNTTNAGIEALRSKIDKMKADQKAYEYHKQVIENATRAVEELEPQIAVHTDLKEVYGRNGVPRKIISRWINAVETETNRQLNVITNGQFTINFIDKTETGRDTIDLIIIDNHTGDERKFKALSGGERTRINVALALAMSNVFSDLTGIRIDTLWFDEVYGLDENGQRDFATCVEMIANEKPVVGAISCFDSMTAYFSNSIVMQKGKIVG